MPSIGTAARVGGPSRSIESGVRLPALLAEIDGADPTWCDALDAAVADARQLGAELDLRLILGGPDEGSAVLERLEDVPLVRLGVFDRGSHMTEIDLWQWLSKQPFVRSREIDLVVGTRAHFTELNRSHERIESVLADADGAAFSITPQMHATEVRHIVSSVRAQGEVVRSAAAFLGSSPIHIGPITLESRFNAVATKAAGAAVQTMPDELTVTPFAAAWLVGSLAAIVPANVASLAYFRVGELSGTEAGLLLPELAKLAGLPVLAVGRGADSSMAAFAVAAADGPCVYFSNLSRSPRHIVIENADGDDHPVLIPPWSYRSVELAGVVGR
jgi:hypothetical protein